MPPKRQIRQVTPPSAKKVKKAAKSGQPSIDSFFASPTKAKAAVNGGGREASIISIEDSDEEVQHVVPAVDKGKSRSKSPIKQSEDPASSPVKQARVGVNGSSSSSSPPPPSIKEERDPSRHRPIHEADGATAKPVHPMFAPRKRSPPASTPLREIKPDLDLEPGQSGSAVITSTAADSVEPINFDTDASLFRPEMVDTTAWPKGKLPYSVLVGVYVQVSSTRSRLTIVRVLSNFLHLLLHAAPADLTPSLYLLSNHLLPSYLPCELGIGSQILSKAVQEVSGCQPRDLKKLWEKWGDPGDVAFEAKSNLRTLVKPAPLLVGDVYKRLLGLSRVKGSQSGKVKGDVVRKLMVQARGEEVRFLVRSLIGNLRIGAVRLTLLTALARATALFHCPKDLLHSVKPIPQPTPKAEKGQKRLPRVKVEPDPAREEVEALCVEATKLVRKVYVRHPNYGDLVKGIQAGGLEGLEERVPVSVGIPLSPMLGSITRSLNEVFTRLGSLPFTAEAKLDGQRVQIHARLNGPEGEDDGGGRWVSSENGTKVWVRLFSRHLEDMTEKYPDICQLVLTLLERPLPAPLASVPSTASTPSQRVLDMLQLEKVTSFIMDAEVVAVDKDTGAYRTFQDLSNRAKKDVQVADIKVVVGVYAFDLMLLNDQASSALSDVTLLSSPFSHRRHLLHTLFPTLSPSDPTLARFAHIEHLDSSTCTDPTAEMQAFFEMVVEQKCEGLMVKLLESGEGLEGEDAENDEGGDGEGKAKAASSTPKRVKRDKDDQVKAEVIDELVDGVLGKDGRVGRKKPLPATYEPDQRSQGWLKVKKDYLEGLGDSLDLVPIGAWWGQGRKAGWWSPILLACHNPETGALEAVCKCISGFTDAFYKDLLVRFPPHNALPEKCNKDTPLGYYETNGLRPDVWFEPSEVWEIRGADITLSPVYPAAASLLGSERGLSMRFPRFMRRRDDKSWEQASTSDQFAEMYRKQIREAPARDAEAKGKAGPYGGAEILRRVNSPDEGDGEDGEQGRAKEREDEDGEEEGEEEDFEEEEAM